MLNLDLEKRLLQFMKGQKEGFKSGVYLVRNYELFVAVGDTGILVEDSEYLGVKVANVLGSLDLQREDKYSQILDLLPDFPRNFKYLCEDFVTTFGKHGERKRGVPEEKLQTSNVFSTETEKPNSPMPEMSSPARPDPWEGWTESPYSDHVLLNLEKEVRGREGERFVKYKVAQFSIILKYDSIALLVRFSDGKQMIPERLVEAPVAHKIGYIDKEKRHSFSDLFSSQWIEDTSVKYLLHTPDASRSDFHMTSLTQNEFDLWVGISHNPAKWEEYFEFCKQVPQGKYLSLLEGSWKTEIRSLLIENYAKFTDSLEEMFGLPKDLVIKKLEDPFVWKY